MNDSLETDNTVKLRTSIQPNINDEITLTTVENKGGNEAANDKILPISSRPIYRNSAESSQKKSEFSSKARRNRKRRNYYHYLAVILALSLFVNVISIVFFKEYLLASWMRLIGCAAATNINIDRMNFTLHETVVGQDTGIDLITRKISDYLNAKTNYNPFLLISVHGSSGVGKTKFTDSLMNHFCSTCVQKLIVPIHFLEIDSEQIHERVAKFILKSANSYCSIRLIIFEEMEFATPALISTLEENIFSAIKDLTMKDQKLSKTVVVFTSKTGSKLVDEYVTEQLTKGKHRRDIPAFKLNELIIESVSQANEVPMLWSHFLKRHYRRLNVVPFLPLEKEHVEVCVANKLKDLGKFSQDELDRILNKMNFIPEEKPVIAENGCKRVESEVNFWTEL